MFQPGGSNIEENDNFVLNNNSFFGYFDGKKNLQFDIDITRPEKLYPSTYLAFTSTNNVDHFSVGGYNMLVDNPILYCEPDIVKYYEGDTEILISVYSQTGNFKADKIKEYVQPITSALAKFWGGALPIDKYCFLVYLVDPKNEQSHKSKGLGGYGALEHNRCSFYYLPEIDYEKRFKQMIFDVSAHEFLHIITPLNLHSDEIGDFDFIDPKMSQHLWLYEGVTEYFSLLVQVESGLMSESDFMKEIRKKINQSTDYKNVSFTRMSANILSKKYQKEYTNVYSKGAVMAFLLDLKLMQYSDKRLIDVIRVLVDKYGAEKSFSDDSLINEIVALTSPEIELFFKNYIIGYQTLPYRSCLDQIGWIYFPLKNERVAYFGSFGVIYEDSLLKIDKPSTECLFDFKQGDVLNQVDSIEVTDDNVESIFDDFFSYNKSFEALSVIVTRDDKRITLRATPKKATVSMKNYVVKKKKMSQDQMSKNHSYFKVE